MFLEDDFYRKFFLVLFLTYFSFLFAGPIRFSVDSGPMDRYGLNPEYLTSNKTRALDSLNCELVGGWFRGPSFTVYVVDTLAYMGAGQSMKILNVQDSTNPVIIGEVFLPVFLISQIMKGDYA